MANTLLYPSLISLNIQIHEIILSLFLSDVRHRAPARSTNIPIESNTPMSVGEILLNILHIRQTRHTQGRLPPLQYLLNTFKAVTMKVTEVIEQGATNLDGLRHPFPNMRSPYVQKVSHQHKH